MTNSGELGGTTVYLFDGQKIIETRDGSGTMVQQFIAPLTRRGPLRGRAALPPMGFAHHAVSRANGTRYIDELVQMRVKDKGNLYVHQGERSERKRAATGKAGEDARVRSATCPEGVRTTRTTGGANRNVIALTDLGGSVVERYVYTPYGEVTVHQGERDQGGSVNAEADRDGDVDATDKGTPGSTCTGTVSGACRILDLDPALDPARRAKPAAALRPFRRAACGGSRVHGDYDSADAGKFDGLPQGLARHPGRMSTGVDQPFAHQGLLFEPDIGSYQNRRRQYHSGIHRYIQPDPLGLSSDFPGKRRNRPRDQYADGMHLYGGLQYNPIGILDPFGLSGPCDDDCYQQYHNAMDLCIMQAGNVGFDYTECVSDAQDDISICTGDNSGGCGNAPPMPPGDGCNVYPPSATSLCAGQRCFCHCMSSTEWNDSVRACLACYYSNGCDNSQSHETCYRVID